MRSVLRLQAGVIRRRLRPSVGEEEGSKLVGNYVLFFKWQNGVSAWFRIHTEDNRMVIILLRGNGLFRFICSVVLELIHSAFLCQSKRIIFMIANIHGRFRGNISIPQLSK